MRRRPEYECEQATLGTDMPALVYRPSAGGGGAAIVTLHGGAKSKSDAGPDTVERVVSEGVTLVAVDLYLHGEHVDEAAAALPVAYDALLEIVRHSAAELVDAVADLAADDRIDGSRIGVRGESLGAYVALVALGLGAGFACGVSVAGAADFDATLAHALAAGGAGADEVARERRRLRPTIDAIDPRRRLHAIAPRPLLMIHGTADTAVPLAAHRSLYDVLAPHYGEAAGNCIFLTHGGGHPTPAALDRLAWDWLIRTLQRSG